MSATLLHRRKLPTPTRFQGLSHAHRLVHVCSEHTNTQTIVRRTGTISHFTQSIEWLTGRAPMSPNSLWSSHRSHQQTQSGKWSNLSDRNGNHRWPNLHPPFCPIWCRTSRAWIAHRQSKWNSPKQNECNYSERKWNKSECRHQLGRTNFCNPYYHTCSLFRPLKWHECVALSFVLKFE